MIGGLLGIGAALVWLAILAHGRARPERALWPPAAGSWRTAAWAWGLTILIYAGVIQAGGAGWLGLPGWLRWGLGVPLVAGGTVLHGWGTAALGLAGTSGWDRGLRTRGIYGWRRHPQYLGQIAMLAGMALVFGGGWALAAAAAGIAALLMAARAEDAALARRHADHAAYRARVPMLV